MMPHAPYNHPAALEDQALLADCTERRTRSTGPGGQHRNKVETAVVLRHDPTGIEGAASERRSQKDNRCVAARRLRVNLALDQRRVPPDLRHTPSALWRSRVKDGRIVLNPDHRDFPGMLAEALDHVAHFRWDVAKAAQWLDCSTSQLVKLLKHEPRALERVNRERQQRGMRKLQ
jgi:hypothetical protein